MSSAHKKIKSSSSRNSESADIQCPVCGYYCLGHGGIGCIDKPTIFAEDEPDRSVEAPPNQIILNGWATKKLIKEVAEENARNLKEWRERCVKSCGAI